MVFRSFPRTSHNLHPYIPSQLYMVEFPFVCLCCVAECYETFFFLFFCRQLLSERDALELHLKVATLNILKPDSDHLLHLAVDNGDGAVLSLGIQMPSFAIHLLSSS